MNIMMLQEVPSPDLLSQLILWLTPLIVFGATWVVKQLGPKLSGAAIVGLAVPILTAILAAISYFLNLNANNVVLQIALGLVSVFVNEFIRQIKQPPVQ